MNRSKKRLSYCLTCLNRKEQLQQVLPVNLRDNDADRHDVEFVLVDFRTEGVQEWIAQTFARDLRDGYLRYFHCSELHYWHASQAKNTSHRLASGDILVNLDCDNFTGYRNGRFLIRVFEQLGMDLLFHQRNPQRTEANWGRIALSRASFDALGGYDESLMPSGGQDYDLLAKFRARWPERIFAQYAKQQLPLVNHAKKHPVDEVVVVERDKNLVFLQYPVSGRPDFVSHSKDVKMQNLPPQYAETQRENQWNADQLWAWMNRLNKEKSSRDVLAKRCVNNVGNAVIGLPVTEPLKPDNRENKEPEHKDGHKSKDAHALLEDGQRNKNKDAHARAHLGKSQSNPTDEWTAPTQSQDKTTCPPRRATGPTKAQPPPPRSQAATEAVHKKQNKSNSTAVKPNRKATDNLPAKPQRKQVKCTT